MGVDIGGTGVKGAPVDVEKGTLTDERFRILTPKPATPGAVADVVADVVDHFGWVGPIGATFPAVVNRRTLLLKSILPAFCPPWCWRHGR